MGVRFAGSVSFPFLFVALVLLTTFSQTPFHQCYRRALFQLRGQGKRASQSKHLDAASDASFSQLQNHQHDKSILLKRQDASSIKELFLKPIVIYSIFAGRRSTLSIQIEYIKKLLKDNIIDEVHLWDYTCMKGSGDLAASERDWLRTDVLNLDTRIYMIKPKHCNWKEYYVFYARKLHPDDVLIKADDDIVFMDVSRFQGFIDTIREFPEVYLWSANVVNNGVSSSLQGLDGIIPSSLIQIENEINCPGATTCLYRNTTLGQTLHELFLENPQPFFQVQPGKELRRIQGRISINFVAWLGRHAKTTAYYNRINPNGDLAGGPDEVAVTKVAWEKFRETLMVYMPLVVAHASFSPQNLHHVGANLYEGVTIRNNVTWNRPQKLDLPAQANA